MIPRTPATIRLMTSTTTTASRRLLLAQSKRSIITIKPIYTADSTATGSGRNGFVKGTEGFETKLATPKALGGPGNSATAQNPEILFSAGYAGCFMGALRLVAGNQKVKIPDDATVQVKATLGSIVEPGQGFGLACEINVKIPGLDKEKATALVQAAHKVCPYSLAVGNNIAVKVNVL
ncbi:hypothetical protein HDU76_009770 [Blyttiomyces sp. JEL0837]|nr:hypothetical protein HDU76_009770 [Blyttiomyces sp. JEL0837]